MKQANHAQHLLLENTYVKYRYNELIDNNKKLQDEIIDLNRKLDQLYKCHANSVLLLQQKNLHLQEMIREKNSHIRHIMVRHRPRTQARSLLFEENSFEEESEITPG